MKILRYLIILFSLAILIFFFSVIFPLTNSSNPFFLRLIALEILSLLLGAVCFISLVVSLIKPALFAESLALRKFSITVALCLPLLDLIALYPGSLRTLLAHIIFSLALGSIIALGIASAWLTSFGEESNPIK